MKKYIAPVLGCLIGILVVYFFGLIGVLIVLLIYFGYTQYKKKKSNG